MIDFKNKDELTTNVVICGSLAVFVIAGACMLLLPKPTGPDPRVQRTAVSRIKKSTEAMTTAIEKAKSDLSAETWPGSPEDIGPVVLKQVNTLLQSRHLKLAGFHAEKTIEQPNLTLIPFVISVDGGFNSVMAFTKDLEKPGTKLAVNLFQVSNADQTTDRVTASIGITTYQLPAVPASTTEPASTTPVKTQKGAKTNA